MGYGVMLTRAQPFHLGHMDVVNQMLAENDKALILIGSANKSFMKRNPLPADFRRELVENIIINAGLEDRVKIGMLADWSMEDAYEYVDEWGLFLYYNIVNIIQEKKFVFYYNDDSSVAKKWFANGMKDRVTVKNAVRKRDVSGTKIREAVLNEDYEWLKTALNPSVYECVPMMKTIMETAYGDKTKKDFIMQ